MVGTIGVGKQRQTMNVPHPDYHGTDFRLLLESMQAGMSFTDLDDRGRAHCLGILQGMTLARTMKLAAWDLNSPFQSFDL